MTEGGGRRGRRKRGDGSAKAAIRPPTLGPAGGRYRPLAEADTTRIIDAAKIILARTGMSEAPEDVAALAEAKGAISGSDGRLRFPETMVDTALGALARPSVLHGRDGGPAVRMDPGRVHVGTGGAAPMVVDLDTGRYRKSTLADLFDAARLTDALDNIHFFSRSLVARDMPDERALDLNTAHACLAGTRKHVCTSLSQAEHVAPLAEMVALIAGDAAAFRARPFLSMNVNHVTPPLRFAPDACHVLVSAARLGIPIHCNTFGQLGASSPVTFAGSIAQTVAETLAGMILVWCADPEAVAIFGARPMVTDLRTGAMSGGGGEQAAVMAATAQIATALGLPNSTIAGATDSKIPDAQSGYEKAMAVALAAQAGSNMITQACGMQAGLMAVAPESYVVDNDMLGAILRSVHPIEVSDETLALDAIDAVANGAGHFLGEPETLARMQRDFLYPDIADRTSYEEWEAAGAPDIRERARARAREILAAAPASRLSPEVDAAIRDRFDTRLP
jgi:trimethylamine--corrinoid protein Co-methyltransferase